MRTFPRTRPRRALMAFLFLMGPAFTACEAALDFSREPLQEIPEAGPGVDAADSATADAPADSPAEAAKEAGPTPVDSGSDAPKPQDAAGDG